MIGEKHRSILRSLLQKNRQFVLLQMCNLASIFTILMLAFIYVRHLIMTPGVICGFDWPFPPERYHLEFSFKRRLWSWWYDPAFTGFPANPLAVSMLPYDACLYLWSLFGLNGEAISKIMLVSVLFFSGVSVYFLLGYLKLSFPTRISGAIFYMSVPVTLDWLVVLGPASIITVYALFPLAFLFYLKALSSHTRRNRLKWCILSSLTSTGVYPIFGIILSSLVFLTHTMWMIIVSEQRTRVLKRHLSTLGIIFLTTFATQFCWIQNVLFLFTYSQQELANIVQNVIDYPNIALINSIRLMGFYHPVYENYVMERKFSLLATFIYPTLAFSALLLHKKQRSEILFFSILSLPIIVFWGTQWGWSLVKSNFLMLGVFRDISKVAVIPSLCYTILSAYMIDEIVHKSKMHFHKIIVFILLIIFLFAYINPRLRGDLISSLPQNIVFPPNENYATDFIKQQTGDFKVLWVPTGSYSIGIGEGGGTNILWRSDWYGVFSPKPGTVVGLSQRPVLVPEYWLTNLFYIREFSPAISQTEQLESTEFSLARILGLFNVQYLIYRGDIASFNWFTTYSSPVWKRNSATGMTYVKSKIMSDPELIKVQEFSSIIILLNTKNLPHFFGTTSLGIVGGDLSVIRLLSNPAYNFSFDDIVLAFAIQQDSEEIVKFADLLILEEKENIFDLLIPLIKGAQKIEPGIYAKQEMSKEWSDVHLWYWVYENYQDSLERVAATSSPHAKLLLPFSIVKDGKYLIFSKVYKSRLGSELTFNLINAAGSSLGRVNVNTFDSDKVGFQWIPVSNNNKNTIDYTLENMGLTPWNLTQGSYILEIYSSSGENAIASVLIAPMEEFESARLLLQKIIQEKTVILLRSGIPDSIISLHNQRKTSTPYISWQQVNPTKYLVNVKNSSGPFYLIFLERYDEGWEAYIEDETQPVTLHFPAYGYANAWHINKTGDFNLTITYSPQKILDLGLKISFLAYLTCALFITYCSLADFLKAYKSKRMHTSKS